MDDFLDNEEFSSNCLPNFEIYDELFFGEKDEEQNEARKQRFAALSKDELNSLVTERESQKTKKATKWAVSTFKAWCKEKQIQTPLEQMAIGQIDMNLRRFYAEARTKTGADYSKSTLLSFRHGIERFLNQPQLNRSVKLSTDARFKMSNQMLDAKITSLKRQGKQATLHKPPIEEQDLLKLKSGTALSVTKPLSLLWNVWFHIVLHFCRRGREGQRQLTTSSIVITQDSTGRKFAKMTHDEATKNHPGGIQDVNSFEKEARMYSTHHANDGLKALELYLNKVNPNCSALFQYPKRNWMENDDVWFEARPLGENKLGNIMKEISKAAGLSKIYTNHSVRATAITLWSNAGVPNRHIMSISGHRSEQSLAHYNSRPSTSQLFNCSRVLSNAMETDSSTPKQSEYNTSKSLRLPDQSPVALNQLGALGLFNSCSITNVHVVVHTSNESPQT